MVTESQVRISWSFDREEQDEAENVLELLRKEGATAHLQRRQGVIGIVEIAIAAAIGISALSSVIIRILRTKECGVIIDARGPEVKISKNCDLPRGTVTTISRAGDEMITDDVPGDRLSDLIKAAIA